MNKTLCGSAHVTLFLSLLTRLRTDFCLQDTSDILFFPNRPVTNTSILLKQNPRILPLNFPEIYKTYHFLFFLNTFNNLQKFKTQSNIMSIKRKQSNILNIWSIENLKPFPICLLTHDSPK